jgi:hypothetical protein
MRRLFFTLSLLAALPALAMPSMVTKTEQGVTFTAPEGWKTLVTLSDRGITISRDAFTSFDVHWYDYKAQRSMDQMLDLVLKVTSENLPMGGITETSRVTTKDGTGRIAFADFKTMGYVMKMGFGVSMNASNTKVKAVIFRTSPDAWTELEAPAMIEAVMAGVKVP